MHAGLTFHRDKLAVSFRGRDISLLPKEFALLAYLCRHEGRSFTREQLLDAVWPMEMPVDRTVDDHIYRLRKKLAPWETELGIETVRGVGYRFVRKRTEPLANPLRAMPGFNDEMQDIARTYLRYGRGDALLALYNNKDMFGFDVDPGLALLIRALEGDVRFVVDPGAGPIRDRAFLLLYLHQYLDPLGNRPYVEAAIRDRPLPPLFQNELETMLIVHLLMDWGEYDLALTKLQQLTAKVQEHHWEGLIPYCANLRLEYALHEEGEEEQRETLRQAEHALGQYPYMREEGQLSLLKGMFLYRSDRRSGETWLARGLDVLGQSQFVLHLMHGMRTVLLFSQLWGLHELHRRFEMEMERILDRIGLYDIQEELKRQLDRLVGQG